MGKLVTDREETEQEKLCSVWGYCVFLWWVSSPCDKILEDIFESVCGDGLVTKYLMYNEPRLYVSTFLSVTPLDIFRKRSGHCVSVDKNRYIKTNTWCFLQQVCVKPDTSCHPSMLWLNFTKLLVLALLVFQVPHKYGLHDLVWSSSSSCKPLRCFESVPCCSIQSNHGKAKGF